MSTNKNKPTSRQALYSKISSRADEIVTRLIELTQSKNENVALGACKLLLNKTLPDIKTLELTDSEIIDLRIKSAIEQMESASKLRLMTLT